MSLIAGFCGTPTATIRACPQSSIPDFHRRSLQMLWKGRGNPEDLSCARINAQAAGLGTGGTTASSRVRGVQTGNGGGFEVNFETVGILVGE